MDDGRRVRRGLFATLLILVAAIAPIPPAVWAAEALQQIPAAMHVHTTWSTGDMTLDQLIARARGRGLQAVFLTENLRLRFEYGLFPLRNLLRYRVEFPSLLNRGPEAFLEAVRSANSRQGDVLLIPGTEVSPYYYWTGNLFRGTLTMHDGEKKLLAFGLYRAGDYRSLPAVSNPGAGRWGLASLWLLSPAVLAIPGAWLLTLRRRRTVRLQHFRLTEERRYTGYGLLCLAVAALLLANNYPFRMLPISAYDPDEGLSPFQAVVDYIHGRGGLVAWSLPEARDYQKVRVAGFQATVLTEPYPSSLLETDRFTAFGGIYEDTTTFTNPGGGWDQLLLEYVASRRTTPAWAIGEAAYHHEGQAGKRLGEVQTVFLVERKDPTALMDALRRGRLYALRRTSEVGLALDQFQVTLPGQPAVEAGDALRLTPGEQPEVQVSLRTSPERRMPVLVRLIRSGSIVHSLKGETPLALRWKEAPLPSGARLYYRLDVHGPSGHQILSNPIFVQVAGGAKP